MAEGKFITEADFQARLKEAMDAQSIVFAEAINARNEEIEALRAEVEGLKDAQNSPLAPPSGLDSMMLLGPITKSLTKFSLNGFQTSYMAAVTTMNMWERNCPFLSEDVKLDAILKQIPAEDFCIWIERVQICLEQSTPEKPAWLLLLDQMYDFYVKEFDTQVFDTQVFCEVIPLGGSVTPCLAKPLFPRSRLDGN